MRPSPIIAACERIRCAVSLSSIVGRAVPLRRAGGEWKGCCPFHADRSPSFTIYADDRRFYCFGCGASGDALDFVQRSQAIGLADAIRMIDSGALPACERVVPIRGTEQIDIARDAEAAAIWQASAPATGTAVDRYLASRGLGGPVPETLRFARLHYGSRGDLHPVMVSLIVDAAGQPQGIQRTYLNASGSGKAAVPKPKLSLGRVKGGAVRLAPPAGEIVVCEGIEDALSIQRDTGLPCWAAAGAGMLPAMILPRSIRLVTIGADADETGERSAREAQARFVSQGRSCRIIRPSAPHKDFNAELCARRGRQHDGPDALARALGRHPFCPVGRASDAACRALSGHHAPAIRPVAC